MRDTLLVFLLIILIGAFFRRSIGLKKAQELRQSINLMVLNLFLPALCLRTIYLAHLDRSIFLVPLCAALTILSVGLVAYLFFQFWEARGAINSSEKGVLILSSTFGNVTYLGIPVLSALLGPQSIKHALYYDLLATTPLLWLVGAPLAARWGKAQKSLSLKDTSIILLKLPPLWGILGGLTFNLIRLPLPSLLLKILETLGNMVVPLMIFSIGLALSLPSLRRLHLILPVAVLKLVFSPWWSFQIAKALSLEGPLLKAVVLEGGMPTMVLSLLIAAEFGLEVSLSALAIVVTTMLSFLSLPLIFAFFS